MKHETSKNSVVTAMQTMLQAIILLMFLSSCAEAQQQSTVSPVGKKNDIMELPFSDGFDFPFGDGNGGGAYMDKSGKAHSGWYIATRTAEIYSLGIHTGEDWNGNGGGNSDEGQPVYAAASGEVVESRDFGSPWGNVVMIRHLVLENLTVDTVYSSYAHLGKRLVQTGDQVVRRQEIGNIGTGGGAYPAHLHLEIRKQNMRNLPADYWPSADGKDQEWTKKHYFEPSDYIQKHRKCLVPSKEKQLLIAHKSDYRMKLYAEGKLVKEYRIALGQSPDGHKLMQGDNKTPEGQYRIIEKSVGPFGGAYGSFLGSRWMRLNYPNTWDAENGLRKKMISRSQFEQIEKANLGGREPLKTTKLGGGIGIHGWSGNWPGTDRQNLTWGCISMEKDELEALYSTIHKGCTVLIYP
jgi:hypothetical protein